jgi:Derlin-2/3|eukprot:CAMPEP_0198293844 /NCGR_PEP_ID=MMETSP1449-20131203/19159_1 /TAXON_ID=420275 /ORGANISM="Attheya septentrionalis, Strain CCMP2084" /LENGTH=342 /DNA_ID=CAMNT_0043993585 /DNA_START=34 /DNA_END=1062 /DNA_ORIENTATION=+
MKSRSDTTITWAALFLLSAIVRATHASIPFSLPVVANAKRASFASRSPLSLTTGVTFPLSRINIPRGGAASVYSDDEDESSDEDFDEDFDDDEDMFGLDDADFDADDDDFAEDNTLDRMLDAWKKTPPFTKTYLSASIAATMIGYLFNGNQFPSIFLLEWKPTLTQLQLWRPFTAFLNFGPMGLGFIMTGHFVWTYMSTLERLNHDRPYDFWVMIVFGCASMVAGYSFLQLPPRFLGHNLSTFLVYIWSRYHEGLEVNMFELFNTRAEMLPWFFLAQTFLLEGEFPVLDLLGIVFGHIYHHCKTTNILRTPQFIIDWYNSDGRFSTVLRKQYKAISSDFELQ